MNYCKARQRTDGNWAWTILNDGIIWTAPCCLNHPRPHATQEEAERCFYDYELDTLVVSESPEIYFKCQICQAYTNKEMRMKGGWKVALLCDAHLSIDFYKQVHPFVAGLEVTCS